MEKLLEAGYADKPSFKQGLSTALRNLDTAYAASLNAIMNIAMTGPYARLGELFDNGDSFTATPEMFADTDEPHIEAILEFIESILSAQTRIELTLNDMEG